MITGLAPRVRAISNQLVDGLVEDGQAEMIGRFALPLPMTVILDLLGSPREDMWQIKRWCDEWSALVLTRLPLEEQLTYHLA